jgi:hypothetical protein
VCGKDTFRRSPTKVLQGLQRNGLANFLNMKWIWNATGTVWTCIFGRVWCHHVMAHPATCHANVSIAIIGVARPNEAIVACSNITFVTVLQHITMYCNKCIREMNNKVKQMLFLACVCVHHASQIFGAPVLSVCLVVWVFHCFHASHSTS